MKSSFPLWVKLFPLWVKLFSSLNEILFQVWAKSLPFWAKWGSQMPQIHQSFTFCKRKRPNCLVNQGKVHTFAASLERGAGKTAFWTQNKDASQVVVKVWRDGRVVDYNGLENRRTERYRGFESLSLRNITWLSVIYEIYTQFYTQKCKVGCFLLLLLLTLFLRKDDSESKKLYLKI